MVLLVLAHVSLPAEVRGVDRLNQQIHLIGWFMLKVQITALFGLLTSDVVIFRVSGAILDKRLSEAVLVPLSGQSCKRL